MVDKFTIGQEIKIIDIDERPEYSGKLGIITDIDKNGQLHGTWGNCSILPGFDIIEIIKKDI